MHQRTHKKQRVFQIPGPFSQNQKNYRGYTIDIPLFHIHDRANFRPTQRLQKNKKILTNVFLSYAARSFKLSLPNKTKRKKHRYQKISRSLHPWRFLSCYKTSKTTIKSKVQSQQCCELQPFHTSIPEFQDRRLS